MLQSWLLRAESTEYVVDSFRHSSCTDAHNKPLRQALAPEHQPYQIYVLPIEMATHEWSPEPTEVPVDGIEKNTTKSARKIRFNKDEMGRTGTRHWNGVATYVTMLHRE